MEQADEIVFTGMGVVSPIGIGVDAFWKSLLEKKSGVRKREDIGVLDSPFSIAANIVDFEPKEIIKPRKLLKVMCRQIQLGFAASTLAVENAKLKSEEIGPDRIATIFGSESFYSATDDFQTAFEKIQEDGKLCFEKWGLIFRKQVEPLWMLNYLPNMVAAHVSIGFDTRGPSNSIMQSDASSLLAIIESAHMIERGMADMAITGGTGCFSELTGATYRGDQLLSRRISDPRAACRPFDAQRDGTVLGEGAASFVIEKASLARQRNVPIYARLLGSARAYGNPEKPGELEASITNVINAAIERSGLQASDIGHVNANGTGKIELDGIEAKAIQKTLGNTKVIAPKGHFGSLGGGTGAVELVATLAAFQHKILPPTMNCEVIDEHCPINVNVESEPLNGSKPAIALNITSQGQIAALVVAPHIEA